MTTIEVYLERLQNSIYLNLIIFTTVITEYICIIFLITIGALFWNDVNESNDY